jgi:hypothetical protein
MYYDDQARRFNFVSGLLFGTVLGAGLALLLPTQKRVRVRGPRLRLRGGRGAWVTGALAGLRGRG